MRLSAATSENLEKKMIEDLINDLVKRKTLTQEIADKNFRSIILCTNF